MPSSKDPTAWAVGRPSGRTWRVPIAIPSWVGEPVLVDQPEEYGRFS